MSYPPQSSRHAIPGRTYRDYSIGVICALAIEKAAFEAMLDHVHDPLPNIQGDDNSYTLGQIGVHNIVVACLPAGITGTASAATVAKDMLRSFPIKVGLMVGIGGGVWSMRLDIRLGDVIVGQPDGIHGGVVQWDFGKMEKGGQFIRTGALNKPPRPLLNAVQDIKIQHLINGDKIGQYLSEMAANKPKMGQTFGYPGVEYDQLFDTSYDHTSNETCEEYSDCENCDRAYMVVRTARESLEPRIYYGNIASGNKVIKHGMTRDQIARKEGVICFEMEAAGLMDSFPCLVIRGICDYADSHKNNKWQPYAAATAAAFAKDLLGVIRKQDVDVLEPAQITCYHVPFILEGIPRMNKFVDRPADMRELEKTLLPTSQNTRQKIFVLHGLGGIGKTQLAVEFARRHHTKFSAVFWLSGNSEDSLKHSIASCAKRIPVGQISDRSRGYSKGESSSIDAVVAEVLAWLAQPENMNWLLVFDNIDREYISNALEPLAYDINRYLPIADHGSILITTRLLRLAHLWNSKRLDKVDHVLAKDIFQNWYGKEITSDYDELLGLLDGLPLALAQAASYLRETGLSNSSYLRLYKQQWDDLTRTDSGPRLILADYQRSINTTWSISFEAIKRRNESAANLLLFWALLDSKDLWYGLLQVANNHREWWLWPEWFRELAGNEVKFLEATKLLLEYSMINTMEFVQDGYAMHPVVHTWASHVQGVDQRKALLQLVILTVGYVVRGTSSKDYYIIQRRLLPHAERCMWWVNQIQGARWNLDEAVIIEALFCIGCLYGNQGKLQEAEALFQMVLKGCEKTLGPNHILTLHVHISLGRLYKDQSKLREAEEMLQRALGSSEEMLGLDHVSTLNIVHTLGTVWREQGKLPEAEAMCHRALCGNEKALGPEHTQTIRMVHDMGVLYQAQGKLQEAEAMYRRALEGYEKVLGLGHIWTLSVFRDLGILYFVQGNRQGAEVILQHALEGNEKVLGPDHILTLRVVHALANLYSQQGKLREAEALYQRALKGNEKVLGPDHASTLAVAHNLGILYKNTLQATRS